MALKLIDGFPYVLANIGQKYTFYSLFNCNPSLNAGGRWGSRYLYFSYTNRWGYTGYTFGGSADTVMFQCGFARDAGTSKTSIVAFMDNLTPQVLITMTGTVLTAERYFNAPPVQLGSPATLPVTPNVWHQLEVKVKIADSPNGTVLVKVDGVEFLNITNVDTKNTANAKCDGIQFGSGVANYYWQEATDATYWSDIIMMDTSGSYCNDLLGTKMVKPGLPTANGNYAQWTPLSGQNYENVDDAFTVGPDGDTSYNKTAGVNNIDSFVIPDVPAGATINGVACTMYAKLEEPGVAKLKGLMRTGSTDGEGTEISSVPSSYAYLQSFIYVDPVSGVPMTAAEFNAAQFGYKRSA